MRGRDSEWKDHTQRGGTLKWRRGVLFTQVDWRLQAFAASAKFARSQHAQNTHRTDTAIRSRTGHYACALYTA